jgi:pyruvate dehydrogenase E2 component (dihydrolipoamide acetyltransferase)
MPSLGADMEAGTLVEWMKRAGDQVERGDIVAVVETDKGAIEVEIFETGRIEELLVEEGAKVPVGTPLARIAGEGAPAPLPEVSPATMVAPSALPSAVPAPATPLPSGVPTAGGQRVSPAARRLASERGIDLAGIAGSGPGGSVIRADIERVAAHAPKKAAKGVDLGLMRRAIAAAMARSKREIPHYYLSHSFDATAAHEAVEKWNDGQPPEGRILLGALLVKATALALREFPEFNGFFGPEGFAPSKRIHLGIAIAIRGGGLAAPAIHDTDRLPLGELMARMRDLVGRVRRGGFRSSEIADPTATVSSLGDRGVEALLPVIYPPQVAIFGFGTVQVRPWVADGRIAPRRVLTATLAADHRVSDGHRGALLLRRIEDLLQESDKL